MRNAKKHQRHRSHDIPSSPQNTERQRRVSFDLAHNTVHILPSMKQIKHMIQMREKAEQEKQATSQAILDEHIVNEIEQGLRTYHCLDSDTDTPPMAATTRCIKSCLKKTPTKEVESCSAAAQEGTSPCKSTNSKCKNHKKEHHHHQASSSKEYASTDNWATSIAAH